MIRVDVDISGFERMLAGVDAGLRDLTPVWGDVRDILVAFVKKHFDTQGAYAGQEWRPLSPAYAAWKERHAPGKAILRLRDRLYGSLTKVSGGEQVFRPRKDRMEWGTRVPYARIHQTGSLKVADRPPKRVVLPAPTRAEGERIADAFLAHMLRKAQGGPR